MVQKEKVISQQEIAQRVKELGRMISGDYADSQLVVIGILNGAFIFAADLVREIDLPLLIDFVRVASYGSEKFSSGQLTFTKDIELDITGKDVLVVEDIVDSGFTLSRLKEHLFFHKPKSVKVCALINKTERREIDVLLDYVGFDVQTGFLIGYGLDCAEKFRNYPAVYHLLEEKK